MNAPKVLNDIIGQDMAGFTLAHARGIAMSSDFAHPVVMTETQQPIVSSDEELLELVASHISEPHAHGRPKVDIIVHVESSTAYKIDDGEPFAGTRMHLLTRDEYERLKDTPGVFSWRRKN